MSACDVMGCFSVCSSCGCLAGVQPVPLQTITNENPAGPSLGTIPQARFLLSMLHMLTLKHGANSLSLLLNSGMLALTQSVLRLIGKEDGSFHATHGSHKMTYTTHNAIYTHYNLSTAPFTHAF